MIATLVAKVFNPRLVVSDPELQKYFDYIEFAYPSNHTYQIVNMKLLPKRQLAARYKVIRELFPTPLTSLVDIGCSKGFFVFSASDSTHFTRGLGLDVNQYNVEVCQSIARYLSNQKVQFQALKLHELAGRIDELGGPYQTVLLLNTYQYLYFGSDDFPVKYLNHDVIFKDLRKVCSQRVIFNNRVNIEDCQNTTCIERANTKKAHYTEERILEAASRYFKVVKHGKLGRYPLWTLEVV
ncbi:MAG: hypothetical protein A3E84_04855 [Gammaproteobacteria bacterium RIFCSPHIGHO2_12_FULL_42_13]|nr:MAG: hypothetical protein A3E84_04855 [Gammaproteobacteria bacterium RIFCSPHIGHO2_12_FULL_42_13]